jgi:hypothetical protein
MTETVAIVSSFRFVSHFVCLIRVLLHGTVSTSSWTATTYTTGMNQEVEDELLVLEVCTGSASSDTADVVVVDLSGPVDS